MNDYSMLSTVPNHFDLFDYLFVSLTMVLVAVSIFDLDFLITYIVTEVTLENKSEEDPMEGINPKLVYALFTLDEDIYYADAGFDEDVSPGESVTGELIFDVEASDSYEFVYGSPETNEIRWEFDAEELE